MLGLFCHNKNLRNNVKTKHEIQCLPCARCCSRCFSHVSLELILSTILWSRDFIIPTSQMRNGGSGKLNVLSMEREREGGRDGKGTQRVGLQIQPLWPVHHRSSQLTTYKHYLCVGKTPKWGRMGPDPGLAIGPQLSTSVGWDKPGTLRPGPLPSDLSCWWQSPDRRHSPR